MQSLPDAHSQDTFNKLRDESRRTKLVHMQDELDRQVAAYNKHASEIDADLERTQEKWKRFARIQMANACGEVCTVRQAYESVLRGCSSCYVLFGIVL